MLLKAKVAPQKEFSKCALKSLPSLWFEPSGVERLKPNQKLITDRHWYENILSLILIFLFRIICLFSTIATTNGTETWNEPPDNKNNPEQKMIKFDFESKMYE